jgi:hypothetical protein
MAGIVLAALFGWVAFCLAKSGPVGGLLALGLIGFMLYGFLHF